MLVGRRHKIIKGLVPTCTAIEDAIKKSFDMVRQSGNTVRAIELRDAVLNIETEINKVLFYMAERKKQYDKSKETRPAS